MTATLTVAVDDQSAIDAMQQLDAELADTEKSADQAAAAARKLGQQFDQAADEADRLARELNQAEQETKQLDRASQGLTSSDGGLGLLKLGAVVEIATKIAEGFVKVREQIDMLAEGGNTGAQRLVDSFSRFEESLKRISDDPAFVKFLSDTGDVTELRLIPAFERFVGFLGKLSEYEPTIQTYAYLWGKVVESIDESEKATSDFEANLLRVDAVNKQIAEETRRMIESEKLARLESFEAVAKAMEEERERLRLLGKDRRITDAEAEESAQKQLALLRREDELRRQFESQFERQMQDAENERNRERDRRVQEEKRAAEEINRIREEAFARQTELAKEQLRKEQEAFNAYLQQVQDKLNELSEAGKTAGNKGDVTKAKPSDNLVADQIFQDRTKALQEKQLRERLQLEARQRERRIDPSIDQGDNLQRERQEEARIRSRQRREMERLQRDARRTMLTGRGGNFTDEEVAKANTELSDNVINSAVNNGKLSQEQAAALRNAASVAKQQAQNTEQVQRDVEAINNELQSLLYQLENSANTRLRAQRSTRRAR